MILFIIILVIVVLILLSKNSNKQKETDAAHRRAQEERERAWRAKRAEEEAIRLREEAIRLAEEEHRQAQEARKAEEEARERMSTMRDKAKPSRASQGYKDGYVYILSNEDSYGEDIFKIGMTRREDPLVRVKELNNASVPFDFNLRAAFKVEEASEVETMIHRALNEYRVNQFNTKKEFFDVPEDMLLTALHDLNLPVDSFKQK